MLSATWTTKRQWIIDPDYNLNSVPEKGCDWVNFVFSCFWGSPPEKVAVLTKKIKMLVEKLFTTEVLSTRSWVEQEMIDSFWLEYLFLVQIKSKLDRARLTQTCYLYSGTCKFSMSTQYMSGASCAWYSLISTMDYWSRLQSQFSSRKRMWLSEFCFFMFLR